MQESAPTLVNLQAKPRSALLSMRGERLRCACKAHRIAPASGYETLPGAEYAGRSHSQCPGKIQPLHKSTRAHEPTGQTEWLASAGVDKRGRRHT